MVRALLSVVVRPSNAEESHVKPGSASVSIQASSALAELTQEEVDRANALDQLPSTMIFLNTADAAQRFAEVLRGAGVQCVQFHKLCRSAEREASLRRFREGSVKIFVCTDSAARGLDLPQVRHVVQAEFALNVVQHQHRVGRASRAGRIGRATNFVFPSSRALVDLILRSEQQQQHMEELAKAADWQEEVGEGEGECSDHGNKCSSASDTCENGEEEDADKAAGIQEQRSFQQKGGDDDKCAGAAGVSTEEKQRHNLHPLPLVAGITQAFSRRRGFRRNLRRQKNGTEPIENLTRPSP